MFLCSYSEGRNRERNGPGARTGGREERTGRLAGRDGRGSRDGPRDGRGGGRGRWVMPTGLAFFTGLNCKLFVVWVCLCDVMLIVVQLSFPSQSLSIYILLSFSLYLSFSLLFISHSPLFSRYLVSICSSPIFFHFLGNASALSQNKTTYVIGGSGPISSDQKEVKK